MKLATSIAQNRAHALGVMAGHRLGEAIARTAAESATKATSHDVVASACREAAGDGMYAVEQAAKTLGLTEEVHRACEAADTHRACRAHGAQPRGSEDQSL